MSKSILVLEENSVIHGLVASALDMDGLTVHHEFNPAKYVERARMLQPDLILISNADQDNNYAILRQLKTQAGLGGVPLVLLANSRDRVDAAQLEEFKVAGLVRKPFEASDLQQQVSKHLNLIDLIGSAYEYRKSQSMRDEQLNPLSQIDALDPDIALLLQESGRAASFGGAAVPEVDFSAELREERPAQPQPAGKAQPAAMAQPAAPSYADSAMAAQPSAQPFLDDLGVLDDGPVESFSAGTTEGLLEEDVLLDEEELGPPLGDLPHAGGLPPFADTTLEELGPEDLLDEESYEEATFAAQGVDQTLERVPAAPAGAGLDEIEVELSGEDLAFPSEPPPAPPPEAAAPPRAREWAPAAEPFSDFPAGATAPSAPESDIPPAVRRMMELKPVFSKEAAPVPQAPVAQAPVAQAPSAPAEPAPRGEAAPRGEPAPHGGGEALQFGNEELDDEAIQRALEMEELEELAPLDISDPELLGLTSSDELDLESDLAAGELEPLAEVIEHDDQDLTIDEDEQELILAALDEEREAEGAATFPSGPLELTQEERAGLTEMLDQGTAAGTERTEQDELDLLDAFTLEQETLPAAPAEGEAEHLLDDTFRNTPAAPTLEADGSLDLPFDEVLEVPVPEPALETETAWAGATVAASEAEGSAGAFASGAVAGGVAPGAKFPEGGSAEGELHGIESWETQVPEPAQGAGAALSDSFEDAFEALKTEIEAHPQGERLDDILKSEQLQEAVEKIRFTIPQHEHALARGIPLYDLPEGVGERLASEDARPAQGATGLVSETILTEATLTQAALQGDEELHAEAEIHGEAEMHGGAELHGAAELFGAAQGQRAELFGAAQGQRAGLAASGSLLDEATRARLSQVLDEIISFSVRKAVREEMPRLMERMAKEGGTPA